MSGLPATGQEAHEQHMKVMGAGLHLVKIDAIEEAVNKDKKPIKDKRGYPALSITFRNKGGEKINRLFFYSTLPANDPARSDPDKKCTTEFILANLKIALGIGTEPASFDAIKNKVFWLEVVMTEIFYKDKEHNEIQLTKSNYPIRFLEVGSKFFPGGKTYEEVKADCPGVDPQKNPDKMPDGDFYRKREIKMDEVSKFDCDQKGQSKTTKTAPEASDLQDEPPAGEGIVDGPAPW